MFIHVKKNFLDQLGYSSDIMVVNIIILIEMISENSSIPLLKEMRRFNKIS